MYDLLWESLKASDSIILPYEKNLSIPNIALQLWYVSKTFFQMKMINLIIFNEIILIILTNIDSAYFVNKLW